MSITFTAIYPLTSHMVTDSEGRTYDELYHHQRSFHINTLIHSLTCGGVLDIQAYSEYTEVVVLFIMS